MAKYLSLKNVQRVYVRDGYGKGLEEIGDKNNSVVALCCDLVGSTRTSWFANKYPYRYIEVGVAEQNLVGLGTGLAIAGKIPFISSYAVLQRPKP